MEVFRGLKIAGRGRLRPARRPAAGPPQRRRPQDRRGVLRRHRPGDAPDRRPVLPRLRRARPVEPLRAVARRLHPGPAQQPGPRAAARHDQGAPAGSAGRPNWSAGWSRPGCGRPATNCRDGEPTCRRSSRSPTSRSTRIARTEPTLRDMLQQFRHLFDHLVYGADEPADASGRAGTDAGGDRRRRRRRRRSRRGGCRSTPPDGDRRADEYRGDAEVASRSIRADEAAVAATALRPVPLDPGRVAGASCGTRSSGPPGGSWSRKGP